MGVVNAPLPAMSHNATRAHFHCGALTCQVNSCWSNSLVSVSGIVWRCVSCPSPQTISAIRSGNVQVAETLCRDLVGIRQQAGARQQDLAGRREVIALRQRRQRVRPAIERRHGRQPQIIHVHVAVEFVGGIQLEDIHLADQALVQAPVIQIVHRLEGPIAQAGRRKVRIHGLPSRAQVERSFLSCSLSLIWSGNPRRALGSRMRLIHVAVLRAKQRNRIFRAAHVIDRSVLRIGGPERISRVALHEPVDRLRKYDSPVTAQIGAHLFARNQQEVGVRLRAARVEVRLQLAQADLAGVGADARRRGNP